MEKQSFDNKSIVYFQSDNGFPQFLFYHNDSFLLKNYNDSFYVEFIDSNFVCTLTDDRTTKYEKLEIRKIDNIEFDSVIISNYTPYERRKGCFYDLCIKKDKLTFCQYYPDTIFQVIPLSFINPYRTWFDRCASNVFENMPQKVVKGSPITDKDDSFLVRFFKNGTSKVLYSPLNKLNFQELLLFNLGQLIVYNYSEKNFGNVKEYHSVFRDTFYKYVINTQIGRKIPSIDKKPSCYKSN